MAYFCKVSVSLSFGTLVTSLFLMNVQWHISRKLYLKIDKFAEIRMYKMTHKKINFKEKIMLL